MKAKVKVRATGEVVEIIDFISESKDNKMPKFVANNGREYNFYDLEFSKQTSQRQPDIDWDSVRIDAAIAAMQGHIIAKNQNPAKFAIEDADALVKELRKLQATTQKESQPKESIGTEVGQDWISIKEFEPSEKFCSMYDCLKDKFIVRGVVKEFNREYIKTGSYLGNGKFSCFDFPVVVTHWKPIVVSIK